MADRPQLNPYNPAEPFIKAKLEGHFIDRLLNTMEDFHVPFTQALKYFHNEPEGTAGHFLSLLLDDIIPFKYTTEHGGDWKDYAEEALMLATPAHTRTKAGRLEVDRKRTAEINKKLEELAKKDPNSLNGLYTANKPLEFSTYETLRQMKEHPEVYGLGEMFNVWDDIIVSDTKSGSPQYSMDKKPFPTHTYSRGSWADDKPRLPHQDPEYIAYRYDPERLHTSYDDRGVENYNFTAGELDSYDKPSIRDLYLDDYNGSPYNSWSTYSNDLSNKGISAGTHSKLMALGREYERTVLDETMPYQDKLRKLNELRNEMEVLETLDNLD